MILIHAQVCEPQQWSNSAGLLLPSCLFLVSEGKVGMTYQINTFERTKWAYEVPLALLSLDPSGSLSLETAFVWRICCFGPILPTMWEDWRAGTAPNQRGLKPGKFNLGNSKKSVCLSCPSQVPKDCIMNIISVCLTPVFVFISQLFLNLGSEEG